MRREPVRPILEFPEPFDVDAVALAGEAFAPLIQPREAGRGRVA